VSSPPVTLRPVTTADLPLIAAWGEDPQIQSHFGKVFATDAERQEFIRQRSHRERFAMAIELANCGLIGVIEVVNLNRHERSGELCMYIGQEQYRGCGYGTSAAELFLAFAFDCLALERVYLRVARSNLRAQRCYHKTGFHARGSLRPSPRQPERTEELLLMEIRYSDYVRGLRRRAARSDGRSQTTGRRSQGARSLVGASSRSGETPE